MGEKDPVVRGCPTEYLWVLGAFKSDILDPNQVEARPAEE